MLVRLGHLRQGSKCQRDFCLKVDELVEEFFEYRLVASVEDLPPEFREWALDIEDIVAAAAVAGSMTPEESKEVVSGDVHGRLSTPPGPRFPRFLPLSSPWQIKCVLCIPQ